MKMLLSIGDLIKDNFANVQTGPFGTQLKASEYVESGIPVINVRNIGLGILKEEKLEFLLKHKAEQLKSHYLLEGDIVFARKGAVERHLYVTEKEEGWIQGSDCIRLRISNSDISSKYLSYCFRTQDHQDWMNNLCSFGATMTSLNQNIISKIKISLPSFDKQLRVVDLLFAYDKSIDFNIQQIKLLE